MTTAPHTRSAARRYLLEFGGAMAAYVVVLLVSSTVVRAHPDAGWRFAVAVLPVVPGLIAAWAVLRHLGRIDERERLIALRSFAASALVVGLVSFTYGFLELAGAPAIPTTWVLPALIVVWGLAVALSSARDR